MAERAHPQDPGFKDRWFGLKKSRYKELLYERYAFCNRYIKGKRVLDIPCGAGWGTSLLKGALHITGVDIAQEAISYARDNYKNKNTDFMVGKMQDIRLKDNSADVLICLEGFEHVARDIGAAFLKECRRVLVDNGTLILSCPVLDEQKRPTGNPYHVCEYPEAELIDILNSNFRIHALSRIRGPDGPEYRAVLSNRKDGKVIR